jgi:DNA-binding LytR/AlgR family response regulator
MNINYQSAESTCMMPINTASDAIQLPKLNYAIFPKDILYVESRGNYSKIFFTSKNVLVLITTTALEKILEPHQFMRCHKSYLINLTAVQYIKGKEFVLQNNLKIPISRSINTKDLKNRVMH